MNGHLPDPEHLRSANIAAIYAELGLDALTPEQQEVVVAMVAAYGDLGLAAHIQFSAKAVQAAHKAIKKCHSVLYDVELVRDALDHGLLGQEPLGFINRAAVISQAKAGNQSRARVAVDYWLPHLANSIVLIGESSSALLRLLELLETKADLPKPALVIATPPGFVQAGAAKQRLWELHIAWGIECIVVAGTRGGAVLAATALNVLARQVPAPISPPDTA